MECARVCVVGLECTHTLYSGVCNCTNCTLSWCTTNSFPSCVVSYPVQLVKLYIDITTTDYGPSFVLWCSNKTTDCVCLSPPVVVWGRDFPSYVFPWLRRFVPFVDRTDMTVKTQVTQWAVFFLHGLLGWWAFFLFLGYGVFSLLCLEMATGLLLQITASRKISLESSYESFSVLFAFFFVCKVTIIWTLMIFRGGGLLFVLTKMVWRWLRCVLYIIYFCKIN